MIDFIAKILINPLWSLASLGGGLISLLWDIKVFGAHGMREEMNVLTDLNYANLNYFNVSSLWQASYAPTDGVLNATKHLVNVACGKRYVDSCLSHINKHRYLQYIYSGRNGPTIETLMQFKIHLYIDA